MRAQHLALLGRLHVLDDRDGVVGIEFGGEIRHLLRIEGVDQVLADVIVHLGEHVAVQQVRDRMGQRRALIARRQLEQIGDVGGVQRLDQRAGALRLARPLRRRAPRARNPGGADRRRPARFRYRSSAHRFGYRSSGRPSRWWWQSLPSYPQDGAPSIAVQHGHFRPYRYCQQPAATPCATRVTGPARAGGRVATRPSPSRLIHGPARPNPCRGFARPVAAA